MPIWIGNCGPIPISKRKGSGNAAFRQRRRTTSLGAPLAHHADGGRDAFCVDAPRR